MLDISHCFLQIAVRCPFLQALAELFVRNFTVVVGQQFEIEFEQLFESGDGLVGQSADKYSEQFFQLAVVEVASLVHAFVHLCGEAF